MSERLGPVRRLGGGEGSSGLTRLSRARASRRLGNGARKGGSRRDPQDERMIRSIAALAMHIPGPGPVRRRFTSPGGPLRQPRATDALVMALSTRPAWLA